MAKVKLSPELRTQLIAGPWGTGDPYFDSVVLLLPFDGAGNDVVDGGTGARDRSNSKHPVTFFLNCELDSAQKVYGKVSLYTPASQDYVQVPSSSDFAFGTDDFTIELRVRSPSWSTGADSKVFYDHRLVGDLTNRPTLYVLNNVLRFHNNATDRITADVGALVNDTWQHVAVSRVSGTTRLFVDGTQQGSDYADSTNYTAQTLTLGTAGDALGNIYGMTGWIDEVRITKGVGRYTTNFVPQNTPFRNYKPRVKLPSTGDPSFANVTMLLQFDDASGISAKDFVDKSSYAHELTYGSTCATPADGEHTYDGPAGFERYLLCDGNANRWAESTSAHATAFAIGTGDYTIEWWKRKAGWNVVEWDFGVHTGAATWYAEWRRSTENYEFRWNATGSVNFFQRNCQAVLTLNDWDHIALCRSGTELRMFVNGVQLGATATDSTDMGGATTKFVIGNATQFHNTASYGSLDEFRLTVGVARYTSDFTVESAPFLTS